MTSTDAGEGGANLESPTRGEVWLVRLPRGVGDEPQRVRPSVVISSPAFDAASVRIVVPLNRWRPEFEGRFHKIAIPANDRNGLETASAADFLQVRSVSVERLVRRLGALDAELVEEVAAGVAIAIEYPR